MCAARSRNVLERSWFLGLGEAQRSRPRHARLDVLTDGVDDAGTEAGSARLDREQHPDQGSQAEAPGNRGWVGRRSQHERCCREADERDERPAESRLAATYEIGVQRAQPHGSSDSGAEPLPAAMGRRQRVRADKRECQRQQRKEAARARARCGEVSVRAAS
jgi:hypothetical protein